MTVLPSIIQVRAVSFKGGKEIMLDHAGDDATQAFED